ncbi:hypothetical protein [Paraburkholderia sp. UYCP14C]|uniref:hypothetical protein n=1 Tax=Paraburkholderia sp. UYCP14C TaxID=2511130 RepID=UPI001459FBBC|nr:hypothetical protein [Paraburkholderia sp. UYCP14C]
MTFQLYRLTIKVKEAKARNILGALGISGAAGAAILFITHRAISASTSEFHD